MLSGTGGEAGLSDQHVQEPTESTQQDDLAGLATLVRLPAAQVGQQLHFGPFPADREARRESQPPPSPKPPRCVPHANRAVAPVPTPGRF